MGGIGRKPAADDPDRTEDAKGLLVSVAGTECADRGLGITVRAGSLRLVAPFIIDVAGCARELVHGEFPSIGNE